MSKQRKYTITFERVYTKVVEIVSWGDSEEAALSRADLDLDKAFEQAPFNEDTETEILDVESEWEF